MELGRNVALFLSQAGREAFQAAGIPEESGVAFLYASEIDASGVWVKNRKEDGEHIVLIRWECILAVDVPVGGTPLESAV
jgi:poly-gamma-glutamate capsule biosynthesis protein CapA/YwtB (metallophosphatase superfamily)